MREQLTIKAWIDSIEDKQVKAKVKANTPKKNLDKTALSLLDAICKAFIWSNTKEGFIYWNEVTDRINNNELK